MRVKSPTNILVSPALLTRPTNFREKLCSPLPRFLAGRRVDYFGRSAVNKISRSSTCNSVEKLKRVCKAVIWNRTFYNFFDYWGPVEYLGTHEHGAYRENMTRPQTNRRLGVTVWEFN